MIYIILETSLVLRKMLKILPENVLKNALLKREVNASAKGEGRGTATLELHIFLKDGDSDKDN